MNSLIDMKGLDGTGCVFRRHALTNMISPARRNPKGRHVIFIQNGAAPVIVQVLLGYNEVNIEDLDNEFVIGSNVRRDPQRIAEAMLSTRLNVGSGSHVNGFGCLS